MNSAEMLKINVNEHTEKKNGLTYLTWAWAWAEVLKIDPGATWVPVNFGAAGTDTKLLCEMPDATAFVGVNVTINRLTRQCMLPVMDHRNKAIPKPNAFDVNKAMMRCLAKAISMHGLGLYIYAGEDLPEADAEPAPKPGKLPTDVRHKPTDGAGNGLTDERRAELDEIALYLIDCHREGNDMKAIAVWYEASTCRDNDERVYLWSLLSAESKLRAAIKANKPAAEASA
jgi:hypothetical protein